MRVHKLVQGSAEWHQFRLTHFGASEAAAMLGLSTKVTRTELLKAKKTGIAREYSEWFQEKVLDHGHAVEKLARPIIERIFGEDFYPVTGSNEDVDGKQSASCDGLTISRKRAFEHKQWNEALAAAVRAKQLPEEHMPQCQQVCKITGAEEVVFTVSDGTEENMEYMIVPADPEWFKRIDAGWEQFEKDLQDFVPVAAEVKPVGRAPDTLPALLIEISGQVQASNLAEFHGHAMAVFAGINKDLQTDEDFANAEQTVKWCEGVETKLDAAKQHALAQTASIDELFRTIDAISAEARRVRLDLDKLVKARKEAIKGEIVAEGVAKLKAHIDGLNTRLGKAYMPNIPADFGGVIKNKRNVASIRDAVDTELSRAKIAANDVADRIQTNLNTLRELASEHAFLFSDTGIIVLKPSDDFTVLVKSRIAEHQAAEKRKEEEARERLAREAREKAEADAKAANAAALQEIQGIQQQVIIATTGRLGVRKGGTIDCIRETLAETEAWTIDERFGALTEAAQNAKDSAVAAIRNMLTEAETRAEQTSQKASEPAAAALPVTQVAAAQPVSQVAAALTHAQVVDQMPASVRQAMAPKTAPAPTKKEGPPTLLLGEISKRLGFNLSLIHI